ncbi:MAG: hypothetical protein MK052_01810 [Alphaproteobacteria bacterium]|nr:hypothetical protein [Alphaproteobacteria bacterium]
MYTPQSSENMKGAIEQLLSEQDRELLDRAPKMHRGDGDASAPEHTVDDGISRLAARMLTKLPSTIDSAEDIVRPLSQRDDGRSHINAPQNKMDIDATDVDASAKGAQRQVSSFLATQIAEEIVDPAHLSKVKADILSNNPSYKPEALPNVQRVVARNSDGPDISGFNR